MKSNTQIERIVWKVIDKRTGGSCLINIPELAIKSYPIGVKVSAKHPDFPLLAFKTRSAAREFKWEHGFNEDGRPAKVVKCKATLSTLENFTILSFIASWRESPHDFAWLKEYLKKARPGDFMSADVTTAYPGTVLCASITRLE